MNLRLAAAVSAADADVLVRVAEATHRMAFEVCEHDKRVIAQHVVADADRIKPFAASDRQLCHAVPIHNVDRAERPAIDLKRLSLLFGRVAVALVVGVRLDDMGILKLGLLLMKRLDPVPRKDFRAMLLAGVELEPHFSVDVSVHLLIGTGKALSRKTAREVDDRLVACALLIGNINVAAWTGLGLCCHVPPLPSEIHRSHHRGKCCIETVPVGRSTAPAPPDGHVRHHIQRAENAWASCTCLRRASLECVPPRNPLPDPSSLFPASSIRQAICRVKCPARKLAMPRPHSRAAFRLLHKILPIFRPEAFGIPKRLHMPQSRNPFGALR